MDYIRYNPVKHGWARTVAEWPYSSFFLWSRWAFIHRIGQVWIWSNLTRAKGKFNDLIGGWRFAYPPYGSALYLKESRPPTHTREGS